MRDEVNEGVSVVKSIKMQNTKCSLRSYFFAHFSFLAEGWPGILPDRR